MSNSAIIKGPKDADRCIIWLHGLGASGDDLASLWAMFDMPKWRAVFPNAPQQAVTINGGMVMPAWYDLYSLTDRSKEDEAGLANASEILKDIIDSQIASGIAPGNIVVAGFSQGGAVALYSLVQAQIALGAVISLSAYLPKAGLKNLGEVKNQKTPVLLMHGEYDDVVAYSALATGREKLSDLGYKPETKSYAMAHEICEDQVYDIRRFLADIIC